MYFKVNYCTGKAQYSKLNKNVSSQQVSLIQLLIYILIFNIDADLLGSIKKVMLCISEEPEKATFNYLKYHPASMAFLLTSRIEKQKFFLN